jgi:prepilin-type N-terminal cleavage/methylation domain-containing protein
MSSLMKRAVGFTIIELLITIAIIGILSAVITVSYGGIQRKATDDSILADLNRMDTAQTAYGLRYNTVGKAYYSGLPEGIYDTELDFKPSKDNIIDVVINDSDYCIRGYNFGANKNSIDNAFKKESTPGACDVLVASAAAIDDSSGSTPALSCPSGFITVPGNSLFGTEDFCVMKYEAKDDGDHMISQASGSPSIWWTQTGATTYAQEVENCTGCHLITENEWLTIAHNALNVASNWSSGQVGTGYIYSGNNHASRTAASTNDNDGYYGVDEATYPTDRRTLTLSNGQVIWDLAGNAWEWTSGTITGNQPGDTNWVFREYNSIADPKDLDYAFPSYGTPAATNWTSANGIGKLYTNSSISTIRGCSRGGWWNDSPAEAGIFSLSLYHAPSDGPAIGFRSAAPGQ